MNNKVCREQLSYMTQTTSEVAATTKITPELTTTTTTTTTATKHQK